jgi:hypothetical protein
MFSLASELFRSIFLLFLSQEVGSILLNLPLENGVTVLLYMHFYFLVKTCVSPCFRQSPDARSIITVVLHVRADLPQY